VGTFTRFTFVLFFLPLGLFLLVWNCTKEAEEAAKKDQTMTPGKVGGVLITTIIEGALGGMAASAVFVLADSFYYSSITPGSTLRDKAPRLTITPINNAMYNMNHENLALHGKSAYISGACCRHVGCTNVIIFPPPASCTHPHRYPSPYHSFPGLHADDVWPYVFGIHMEASCPVEGMYRHRLLSLVLRVRLPDQDQVPVFGHHCICSLSTIPGPTPRTKVSVADYYSFLSTLRRYSYPDLCKISFDHLPPLHGCSIRIPPPGGDCPCIIEAAGHDVGSERRGQV
jgi:hypothetical protein